MSHLPFYSNGIKNKQLLFQYFYILIRLKTPYFSALISRTPYFSQANLLSSDSMHYFYDTFNLIS